MSASLPISGLVLLAIFAAAAVACIAVAEWMERVGRRAKLPRSDRWTLLAQGLAAALVAGTSTLGFITVPACLVLLAGLIVVFSREHDAAVPAEQRILTGPGLRRAVAEISGRRPASLTAAGAGGAKPTAVAAPVPLAERLSGMFRRTPSAAVAAKVAIAAQAAGAGPGDGPPAATKAAKTGLFGMGRKPAAAAREAVPIELTKKNGQPAFEGVAPEDLADNVVAAQKMLVAAIKVEATDLHLEPRGEQYHVRYRVDGVLQNAGTLPLEGGKGVISALKVVSDMDISERRRPQDGGCAANYEGNRYDIRAASTPTSGGEKMVLRILKSSGGMTNTGLANIGLRPQILTSLREVIHKPYGMFLVTGPTGSGKTTTVYASLNEIDSAQHNITTIEDPVEYRLEGITQIPVNTQAGVTFASILRSVLRQDPDVLLVGEIRDKETAEIACQAALTGHFVFSTLHANDSVATITRMLDIGLEPMLIQTAVTAVLAQRLARKLCPACKEPYPPPADLMAKLGIKPGTVEVIYREKGCDACGGTGYKGRTGLHELLVMNGEIGGLITAHPDVQALRAAARRNNTRSLQSDGLLKVFKGVTSISEVNRVTT